MKQINSATFHAIASETAVVEPTLVTIERLTADYDAYEGCYIKLENVDVTGKTTVKDSEEKEYKLYDRFELSLPETATNCDIEGIAALYGTTLQMFPMEISHTLSIGEENAATLFLDFPVTIPTDIETYAVASVTDKYAKLEQVEGVLPANTGVIVKTDEATYKKFVYSSEEATAIETNLLEGSVEDTYTSGPAYVLSNGEQGIGFYQAKLNKDAEGADGTTHFLNNANKAFLSVPVAGTRVFLFDFGTETGIECIESIEGAENANPVVYDLTGRRVKGAQKGLYIVNGKVVIR